MKGYSPLNVLCPPMNPKILQFASNTLKCSNNGTFTVHPSNNLVMFMPFKFVNNLDVGKFTKLDKLWLKKLNAILKKAESNSIKKLGL
jgi:hypothetical protein